LSGFGSGMNRFFTDHLAFEILRYFPKVNVDNHFNGVGLHGVYDSKYDRVIITKLDYVPKVDGIIYDDVDKKFYLEKPVECCGAEKLTKTEVFLTDTEYFCNKSWTVSFNFNTKSWISFHSYIPNWYIGENNFFYSGLNDCCGDFDAIVANPIPNTTTTTTSSTTTTSTSTTSTTTTAYTGCDLEGEACEVITTTTTTSSTTSTTTTAYPCECYVIYNSTETTHNVAGYICGSKDISFIPVSPGAIVNLCFSTEAVPYSDPGVIITLCGIPCVTEDDCTECTTTTTTSTSSTTTTTTTTLICDNCYEYTVTADPTATIQLINCNGTTGEAVLSDPTPFVIACAVENSIVIISGAVTIAIGAYCGNTCGTTSTTTTAPL
jgi:hypothetical protein